ncbi:PAC2 family protein [Brachybacterium timonense]|uniref:PAC2 family protein n=1 Tax=Brachybacterium timonense TaxID=2050896 RepID=UPI000D0AD455|nr:PAC2 family protein [Brachybacterium timonense]
MSRIAVTAFSGWNDAGEAASSAAQHLLSIWPARPAGSVDAEEYTDFLVNRPTVSVTEDGRRSIEWPDTRLWILSPPEGPEVVVVLGPEPSVRWKSFCDEVLEQLQLLNVTRVLSLGALLADAPHSRPLPVTDALELPPEKPLENREVYEGPIGIPTILARRLVEADIETRSIWVQVPHYVAQNASPKAALALLYRVQDHLPAEIAFGDLVEEAQSWERSVDELASTDEDVAEYVARLERAQDAAELPEASGDAIAREFEQFLRRRDED